MRLSPSAGALHPIEVLLVIGTVNPRIARYDPLGHSLDLLRLRDASAMHDLLAKVREIVPQANGTTIVLVGDERRVGAKYENPESLFWRDAGALLQTMSLVATANRLACCFLGILGVDALRAIGLQDRLTPTGVAVIGRAPDAKRGDPSVSGERNAR
jgi:SagB-type dehydrogenase family enzyme